MELQYRKTCRTQVTKLINASEELLKNEFISVEDLTIMLDRVKVAHINLKEANEKTLPHLKQDKLEEEFECVLDYDDRVAVATSRLQQRLAKLGSEEHRDRRASSEGDDERRATVQSQQQVSGSSDATLNTVRLPKLNLKTFNGDLHDFIPFWEQFKSAVHENKTLDSAAKFNYLKSVLTGRALDTINGLTPSEACYKDAIEMLQTEYGNKDRIVDSYIQQLINLNAAKGKHDIAGLRKLHNTTSAVTRSLTALGISSDRYGLMVKTILMKSLPFQLKVEFNKLSEVESDSDDLGSQEGSSSGKCDKQIESLLKFIKREVDSVESAQAVSGTTNTSSVVSKEERKIMCDPHYKKRLNENKRDISKDGAKDSDNGKDSEQTSSLIANGCFNDVLLQTACAYISATNELNKNDTFVRVVLDGGSQLTFVKECVSKKLKLNVVGTHRLSIIPFGSSQKSPSKCCNKVELYLRSQYTKQYVKLNAIEVPEICFDALSTPPTNIRKLKMYELADARLAGIEPINGISMLIGADNYWKVVTGETEKVTPDLTAVNTMLGWTLHGPTPVDSYSVNLNMATVLHTKFEEESFNITDFWNLETIEEDTENTSPCPKILGIIWYPSQDELSVNLEPIISYADGERVITKRNILKTISRIYDPFGFLGPSIIIPKILMQTIWKENLEWDSVLPDNLQNEWIKNPADLVTRGVRARQFITSDLWKNGPCWLSESPENWPQEELIKVDGNFVLSIQSNEEKPLEKPDALFDLNKYKSRAFENIGIDFAGPLYITESGRSKKAYIMLLTCAVTRAIHLELVPDISAESCLRGLRRFMSRRGVPSMIYSDNAKTFKRVSLELEELNKILRNPDVQSFALKHRVKWKFIIERAAWWGGFWERLVKTVKDSLKLSIGKAILNFDELQTILTEIEATINARPLTYIDNDPNNTWILTPEKFLIGDTTSNLTADIPLKEIKRNDLLDKWKVREKTLNKFWKRWSSDYLQQLRTAHHLNPKKSTVFKEGDIVLLHEQNIPRTLWNIVRITNLFHGRDGKVRACEVRLPSGKIFKRPIQLLYPLELGNEEEVLRTPGPEDVENI
ncbi:hypothetical protein NQ314_018279 [Rhamnusium bicolor]|uniref:Integrase catalytic domain-containing protein n=1 Tax=Rhamnusium bicolor TaxID=1586634 RepID=A0AAV8WQN6_9CUCU|nr:hypothetical protein NQ314_018279 [Rhamnusium bicolor]